MLTAKGAANGDQPDGVGLLNTAVPIVGTDWAGGLSTRRWPRRRPTASGLGFVAGGYRARTGSPTISRCAPPLPVLMVFSTSSQPSVAEYYAILVLL